MESGAGLPTAAELAAMTGIVRDSAYYRLRAYKAGRITRDELLAPRGGLRRRSSGGDRLGRPGPGAAQAAGRHSGLDGIGKGMGAAVVLTTDRCPVTGGAPTRMSETAFRAVCGKRRDGVWVDPGLGYAPFFSASKRCGECKGKRANWPEELDIIKPEELNMGKKTGVCDICGERKELKHAARGGGLDVCTSCWGLLTAAGKPELLAKAVRLADAEEALAKALDVEPGAGDPADHAIAEAVRECFGRELTVEQLGLRCREEAEKAGRVAEELRQMREWTGAAMSKLAQVLPAEDEGLDDTRSFADIVDLAGRAARRIMTVENDLNLNRALFAERDAAIREIAGLMNYELVEPGLTEQLREIARRIRDELGIAGREITADEEIRGLVQEKLAADAALELRKGEAERLQEALREANGRIAKLHDEGYEVWGALDGDVEECTLVELAEMRMKEIEALRAERKTTFVPPNGPMDEALLRWAITQYQQGKLQVNVEVREVAA